MRFPDQSVHVANVPCPKCGACEWAVSVAADTVNGIDELVIHLRCTELRCTSCGWTHTPGPDGGGGEPIPEDVAA